tara:strand:+ start:58 stop:366 length:309 start_codon:yes stop_codon:yes gene_type:complete
MKKAGLMDRLFWRIWARLAGHLARLVGNIRDVLGHGRNEARAFGLATPEEVKRCAASGIGCARRCGSGSGGDGDLFPEFHVRLLCVAFTQSMRALARRFRMA